MVSPFFWHNIVVYLNIFTTFAVELNKDKPMEIIVRKETDEELMRKACDKTFAGSSKQSLLSMYKSEHSPARTQMFWVECNDIPLYVSTHLLRHHVGSQPFALTHRTDRNGGGYDLQTQVEEIKSLLQSIENNDDNVMHIDDQVKLVHEKLDGIANKGGRHTPTDLGLWMNAQALIDLAKLRLCNHASLETRKITQLIKDKVDLVDADLASMMVRKCVYRNGLCGESCGFNHSNQWVGEMHDYLDNFTKKQKPGPMAGLLSD